MQHLNTLEYPRYFTLLYWNVYLYQGMICLQTLAWEVSESDRTIGCQWKQKRRKKDGGVTKRTESESYVSERNLLFSVYRSPCLSHSFYPREWFWNYYLRGKILRKRVIVTVICILRTRCGNENDCFCKTFRPGKPNQTSEKLLYQFLFLFYNS